MLVAPDHLLAGNAINILTTCFLLIQSPESIRRIDARLCKSLKSNLLVKQGSIYDFKNKKLYNTSISGTFSILLVAGRIFSDEFGTRSTTHRLTLQPLSALQEAVNVLGMLEDLISRTYWYPKINVDGYKAVKNFNRGKGFDRLKELMDYSCEYVKACDRLCRISEHAKKHIDKPNLHRIIELFTHSIPAMGHVRHFSELLFECAHQPLKRGVAMSNLRDPQLQSVRHVLADDWQTGSRRLHTRPTQEILLIWSPSSVSYMETYIRQLQATRLKQEKTYRNQYLYVQCWRNCCLNKAVLIQIVLNFIGRQCTAIEGQINSLSHCWIKF